VSPPDDRDDKPANDTLPSPPSSFGVIDVVPESGGPPIPRGKAREAVLVAVANVARAMGELEATAAAIARALDAAVDAADAT
jgi:hypothetical protein